MSNQNSLIVVKNYQISMGKLNNHLDSLIWEKTNNMKTEFLLD